MDIFTVKFTFFLPRILRYVLPVELVKILQKNWRHRISENAIDVQKKKRSRRIFIIIIKIYSRPKWS